jgi:WG containing repeat
MNWMPKAPPSPLSSSFSKRLWVCVLSVSMGVLGAVWVQYPKVYIAHPKTELHPKEWTPYHQDGKFGYLDPDGNCRIKPRFDGADGFCEGMARVLLNGRFGFIDTSGRMVIPARFAWASPFRGGYASVWTGSDWDYLDKNGQAMVIFPKQGKTSQARSL